MTSPAIPSDTPEAVLAATQRWVERAVIGLNLCPFAKSVQVKGQIHYEVSAAINRKQVAQDLQRLLETVADADPQEMDTALLIVPDALADFLDYNDFLDVAEDLLEAMELEGVLQVASFHPQYQFADAGPDDIENYTNRSPYPIFHILREDSLDRAVESNPDAAEIYLRNQETLRRLGREGWERLMEAPEAASCPHAKRD
ncbi:FIG00715709: hypothetical protein [plant metagenome]|uniref:Peptidase n=1 Tax=plant metagenome TaxID=1297885 RepID=A0A484RZ19_9ZZZZ